MSDSPTEDLGRNEPCHCGSGKKYKRCHLASDAEAQREEHAETAAAEAPASTASEKSAAPKEKPQQRATEQPWKRGAQTRTFQRFQTPPKRGGG